MSRAKKEKSPYRNFTVEDVNKAEENSYIIQVGHELFYEGEYCAFSKDKTEDLYQMVRAGLDDLIKNGSANEKQDAIRSAFNLRVIPLRIQ